MAADLSTTPITGAVVQSAGDCHCLNFGGFATPERRLVFDINDYDETAVAPWEWDLKRLATSFAVATRDQLDKKGRTELAMIVARTYRETMATLAETPILDAWYRALTVDDEDKAAAMGIDARSLRKAGSVLVHAVEIASLSHHPGPLPRIKDQPPLVHHPAPAAAPAFQAAVEAMMDDYCTSLIPERRTLVERYRLADAA